MCWRSLPSGARSQVRYNLLTGYLMEEHERWHREGHNIEYLEDILEEWL
jgi:hypothetical protein